MMEKATGFPYPRSVFAGSNTADGFVSQFDSLLRGCLRVYILKGSPGSGKSTLLRAVAARARAEGEPYTEIICSADTNSLDGVILHGRRTAVIDGTAPHAAEAVYPGASSISATVWTRTRFLKSGRRSSPLSPRSRAATKTPTRC